VNDRARTALNVLAVHAIAAAQAVNANQQQIDRPRLERVLAAIEARVSEARRELEK
jgi:histidine ammonia-lyase